MQQPEWMTHAWAEFGEREYSGSRDNPRIVKFYGEVGQPSIRHDEVAWCAAFVGACLERSGVASTRSLMARSYLAWGKKLEEPRPGAITVLRRGKNIELGHVGFLVRATARTLFLVGGNQSDQVKVSAFARSRLLGFRWPEENIAQNNRPSGATPVKVPPSPPGPAAPAAPAVTMDGVFEHALAHVLEMEGGYSDDPQDPGGATNFGITIGDFARQLNVVLNAESAPGLRRRLRRISPKLVRTIYHQRYWQRASCAAFTPALALMHFDCAVNQGVGRAIRFLQQAVGAQVDGEIGPETIAAAAATPVVDALPRYADLRRRHYRSLAHFKRFGRGWLRRLRITLARANELIAVPPAQAAQPLPSAQPVRPARAVKPAKPAPRAPRVSRARPAKPAPGMAEAQAVKPAKRAKPVEPKVEAKKEIDDMKKNATINNGGGASRKWWGESMTIWGAALTAVTTVLPIVGPLVGLDVTADLIQQLGDQVTTLISAAGGVIGTIMTIFGRARATSRLQRREIKLTM